MSTKSNGACLTQIRFAASVLLTEANTVSDNSLVFADNGDILSSGNFHAEPVAMAVEKFALVIADLANLSKIRVSLLMDEFFYRHF